jgi:hypothetical protein
VNWKNAYRLNSATCLEGWDIPSAYARSAAFAGRRFSEIGEIAARAANVPAFAHLLEKIVWFSRQRLVTYAGSAISQPSISSYAELSAQAY